MHSRPPDSLIPISPEMSLINRSLQVGEGVSCTTETTADGSLLVIKLMSRKNGTGISLVTRTGSWGPMHCPQLALKLQRGIQAIGPDTRA